MQKPTIMERKLFAATSPENGMMIHRRHGHGVYFCHLSGLIPQPGGEMQAFGVWQSLN